RRDPLEPANLCRRAHAREAREDGTSERNTRARALAAVCEGPFGPASGAQLHLAGGGGSMRSKSTRRKRATSRSEAPGRHGAGPLAVVILAAGHGKRMKSGLPKVLQPLAGRPLLKHVIATVRALEPASIRIVYGYGGEQVRQA